MAKKSENELPEESAAQQAVTDPYTLGPDNYITGDIWKVQQVVENNKVVAWEKTTRKPERSNVKLSVDQVREINGSVSPGQKNPMMFFRTDGILFEGQR